MKPDPVLGHLTWEKQVPARQLVLAAVDAVSAVDSAKLSLEHAVASADSSATAAAAEALETAREKEKAAMRALALNKLPEVKTIEITPRPIVIVKTAEPAPPAPD